MAKFFGYVSNAIAFLVVVLLEFDTIPNTVILKMLSGEISHVGFIVIMILLFSLAVFTAAFHEEIFRIMICAPLVLFFGIIGFIHRSIGRIIEIHEDRGFIFEIYKTMKLVFSSKEYVNEDNSPFFEETRDTNIYLDYINFKDDIRKFFHLNYF